MGVGWGPGFKIHTVQACPRYFSKTLFLVMIPGESQDL